MCFRLKHFPAHHNDRTSLTRAVISVFKVHEMRQRLQCSPRSTSWFRGGEGDNEGGNWERKGGKGKGREEGERGKRMEGGEGRGEKGKGKGKARHPAKLREKMTRLLRVGAAWQIVYKQAMRDMHHFHCDSVLNVSNISPANRQSSVTSTRIEVDDKI